MAPSFLQNCTGTFPRKARFPDKRVSILTHCPQNGSQKTALCAWRGQHGTPNDSAPGTACCWAPGPQTHQARSLQPSSCRVAKRCHCPGLGVEGLVPASPADKLYSPDTELLPSSSLSVFSKMDTTRVLTRRKWDDAHECVCKQKRKMFAYYFPAVTPAPPKSSISYPAPSVHLEGPSTLPLWARLHFPSTFSLFFSVLAASSPPPPCSLPFSLFVSLLLFFLSPVLEAAWLFPFKSDHAVRCTTELKP